MGPAHKARDDGTGLASVEILLPGEGALLTSHGETIAGLGGLLKDGAQRRRAAAARRAVLDQPAQPCTLQPPRDLRIAPDRGGRSGSPMATQIPVDHHFTPVFYLNTWSGSDGRVIRYSRPRREVVAKSCAPTRTGSEHHLYTLQGVPPERQAALETQFFQPIDDHAALVHQMLCAGELDRLTVDQRCQWARFMLSMTLRSPFSLAEVERLVDQNVRANLAVDDGEYNAIRKAEDPENIYEWTMKFEPQIILNAHKIFLPGLIDHADLGGHLINMVWSVMDVSNSKHMLLTSDRPFSWSDGWRNPRAMLVFPIGPNLLFVATNTAQTMQAVRSNTSDKIVRQVNDTVARLAVDFVIGRDASQLSFVEKRLRQLDQVPLPGPIGRGRPNCPA